jgi:hypothetical protein
MGAEMAVQIVEDCSLATELRTTKAAIDGKLQGVQD